MTILVTGATGTVGRQVVSQLLTAGQHVRALTRDPARAGLPTGVEVMAGDLTKLDTLPRAFADVTAMHLISFGGDGYAPLQTAEEVVKLAEEAGIRRVTVLSGFEEGPVERALELSSLEWTHLQPVEFMANLLEWAPGIREGVVRVPFARCLSAMVHEADIAAVAVAALLERGHAGCAYTLTGPEAVTYIEALEIIGSAVGTQVEIIELAEDEARAQLRASGLGDEEVEGIVKLGTSPPERAYNVLSTVPDITGRPGRTLRQWAAENVGAFR